MKPSVNNTSNPYAAVLSIDIGNTRTKAGIVDIRKCICIVSAAFPTAEISRRLLPAVNELVSHCTISIAPSIVISSVVTDAFAMTSERLRMKGYKVSRLNVSSPQLPLKLTYKQPRTLGDDRLANALYAVTMFSERPVIVVSAGTAVTVDYIENRTFHGGAIFPGTGLQLKSLHQFTDALPELEKDTAAIPALPGGSTRECILGGVFRATASAIFGIVDMYRKRLAPARPVILTTGGDWQTLSTLVRFKSRFVPEMTLIGAACYYRFVTRYKAEYTSDFIKSK